MNHRDPEIFANPDDYKFDRFAPIKDPADSTTGPAPQFFKNGLEVKYPLLPFGGGVSHCPGRMFAFNEVRILVLSVLFHMNIELVSQGANPVADWHDVQLPRCDPTRVGLGILPPIDKLPFRFRPRARD